MRVTARSLTNRLVAFTAAVLLSGLVAATAHAQNAAPVISGSPPLEGASGQAYDFTPSASDPNGDSLAFGASGLPRWAFFDKKTGRLYGRPTSRDVGTTKTITIAVSDGKLSAALPSFRITVESGGAPTLTGTPSTTAYEGKPYAFTPTASDPEGDKLTFTIAGKPKWATFSRWTGALTGTPGTGSSGRYSGIQIFVSDGATTVALPVFSISVSLQQDANRAPLISGVPATSVEVGKPYLFVPTASDPDAQALVFSIANKPSWATFDTATGKLAGTPGSASVGTYSNISISATDGKSTASLPTFSIMVKDASTSGTASLSWQPPVENVDGTPLTNLAGYRIRYGQSATNLNVLVQIPNAGITSAMIEGLGVGTWYFAVKAYTSANVESDLSNVVQKLVN